MEKRYLIEANSFGYKFLRGGKWHINVNITVFADPDTFAAGWTKVDIDTGSFDLPKEWFFSSEETETHFLNLNDIARARLKRMIRNKIEKKLRLYQAFSFLELPTAIQKTLMRKYREIEALEGYEKTSNEELVAFFQDTMTFDEEGHVISFFDPPDEES